MQQDKPHLKLPMKTIQQHLCVLCLVKEQIPTPDTAPYEGECANGCGGLQPLYLIDVEALDIEAMLRTHDVTDLQRSENGDFTYTLKPKFPMVMDEQKLSLKVHLPQPEPESSAMYQTYLKQPLATLADWQTNPLYKKGWCIPTGRAFAAPHPTRHFTAEEFTKRLALDDELLKFLWHAE